MSQTWFVERHGNLFGPFSVEQVRGLVSAAQLRPTDKVLQQGTSDLRPVSAVPELAVSAGEAVTVMEPLPKLELPTQVVLPNPWNRKRLAIGAVIAAVSLAVALYLFKPADPDSEPDPASPDIPEWFHRPHRIRPAKRQKVAVVPGLGVLNFPKDPPPPAKFTAAWFEMNFTHYLAREAFIYARPEIQFYSDGKIQAGTKALLGETAGEAALICICSETGRPINMYVRRDALRDRSKGPPPAAARKNQ